MEQQESIYVTTADERLQRIDKARTEYQSVQRLVAKNIEQRTALRQREREAFAEFLLSTGADVQRTLDDMDDEDEALLAKVGEIVEPTTANKRAVEYRERIIKQAEGIVGDAGGRMDNTKLAQLLGVNSHGLSGYLEHSLKLRKEYGGRVGNSVCQWVVVE